MAGLLKQNRLPGFLREAASRSIDWGSWDCGLWLADWLMVCGWPDLAADLRGRYCDAATCDAFLNGTPYPIVFRRLLHKGGVKMTRVPDVGDIAVVAHGDGSPVGAIRTPSGWAVIMAKGIGRMPADARVLMAWSV